ncbi:hypothetical protein ACW4TU_01170 [Streptomyces sp. QTS52]
MQDGGPPEGTASALGAHTGADGYPGNTNAWYSEGVMYPGGNDRISSVRNT